MLREKSSAPEDPSTLADADEPGSRLSAIWQDLLGTDEAPEQINFFSAGGDSLKAAKLIARVNLEFGIELALSDIFVHSDFEDFATQVSAQLGEPQNDLPAHQGEQPAQLWPSPMQERRLRHIGRAAKDGWALANWPCAIACELEAPVADETIEDAINALVSRHDALRTGFSFTTDGDVEEFFVLPSATIELHRVQLTGTPRSMRSQLILQHLAEILDEPLSLSEPPLVWARLCRFSENHAALILAIEHLVCDGTSLDLIFDEFAAALNGTLAGRPQALQYSEWVRRQRAQLTGSRREDLLRFWRGAVGDSLPYPDLGLPAPPARSHVGREPESARSTARVELHRDVPGYRASGPLSAEADEDQVVHFTARDLALVRSALGPLGITIFTATLGCIARAWQIMTNHRDMVIHTPVDNRRMSGADTVVGWLSHAVVLRLPLEFEQTSWADRLSAIRDLVLDMLAHQELPLSEVIKDLQPEVYNPGHRRARLFYQYNNLRLRRLPITGGFISDWAPVEDFTWTDAGITFLATEDHRGCRLRIVYDACGVDASFVQALRLHIDETWQDLLSATRGKQIDQVPT
jgi:acyl carrier protein